MHNASFNWSCLPLVDTSLFLHRPLTAI